MSIFSMKASRLTHLFEVAGAPDPQSWAESELSEDIPQLARFLFLRQAWRLVVADTDRRENTLGAVSKVGKFGGAFPSMALLFPIRLLVRAADADLARELLDTTADPPADE